MTINSVLDTLTIQRDIDLTSFNTFGIHAKANYFVVVRTIDEARFLLLESKFQPFSKFILGGGSNILFTKNFAGLLIKNEIKGIQLLSEDKDSVLLKVGAGEEWHAFVMYCIEHGWGGIENLSLIPGTVGAAPIQNIGAYGVEFKDVFQELEAIQISDGAIKIFSNEECRFGYRESIFKSICKDQYLIANVTLRLNKKPTFHTNYGAIQETLREMNVNKLSLKSISDAVIHIRQSKLPDPKVIGNAGSFFKNPIILMKEFEKLKNVYADIPHFPEVSPDFVKVPAGWLIEKCGWKGKRIGDVGVHEKQALVIVNYGKGTGAEVLALAHKIQKSVEDQFGIKLTAEVNIV
jgi:UDP-N-acetylmuramate dehydrogenase